MDQEADSSGSAAAVIGNIIKTAASAAVFLCGGKYDSEFGAPPGRREQFHFPLKFLDNLMHDRKAQTGTFVFGREIGAEYFLSYLLGNSRAGIFNQKNYLLMVAE
jgi:hypothetical protein